MRMAPHDVIFFITWLSWFEVTARFASSNPVKQVALRLDEVTDAQHAVVHVVEVDDGGVVDEVDLAADDRVDDLAERCRGAAHRREVAPHREDLPRDLGRRRSRPVRREHALLDLVETVVDHVGDVEVAVDQHVEDRPQQEALLGLAVLQALELEPARHLVEVDLGPLGARVSNRDQPPGAGHDVDLPARDGAARALAVVDGDVEVVAVAHQLGALPGVEDGVDDGGAHAELGLERVELVVVDGAARVDPDDGASGIDRVAQPVDRCILAAGLAGHVAPGSDHGEKLSPTDGALGRHRAAEEVSVDGAVDAAVLRVRGVLGAVEREQP